MTELRRDHVGEHEDCTKPELATNNGSTKKSTRILHSNKSKQVHPLIVGLVKEQIYHPSVALHRAQAFEMPYDRSDHPRDGGNRLEIDDTLQYHIRVERAIVPPSRSVEHEAHALHGVESQLVAEGLGFSVGQLEILYLLMLVVAVRVIKQVLVSARANAHRIPVSVSVRFTSFELNHSIDCFDELVERDGPTTLPRIKELADLNNLVFGECRIVFTKELLELVGFDPSRI
jgi:hypothetical protein